MLRPTPQIHHAEQHRTDRIAWLRAAVLGANDGILSTASLMTGVAAAHASTQTLLLTGVAALVGGAMSMAASEYVSVSSQADAEAADLARESAEIAAQPEHERRELASIYRARGLSPDLAAQVAEQLMQNDALGAHMQDELGLSGVTAARPGQAAFASAASFSCGALLPLGAAMLASASDVSAAWLVPSISGASLIFLILLGIFSARMGGAPVLKATARVALWGAASMAVTAAVGALFGVSVA